MKKIIYLILAVFIAFPAFSQGFATFIVEGSFHPTVIKHGKVDAPSSIEVIVSEDVNIKNVDFKYRLLSGCSVAPISKDFTAPQKVLVSKNDGSSKEWIINIKQLTPASLPLELSFSSANSSEWTNNVVGWAGLSIDETKPTVIRFGNKDVSFWVAFNEPATKVKYQLLKVAKDDVLFDGEFVVETSANGRRWKVLKEFDSRNQISADGLYQHDLTDDVRFIRWTYVTRNRLNLNLNNIHVTAE
jgi:hypothetical protein